MKFLAERMKLVGPPIQIDTNEEKKIFNEYLKENPKPTTKSWSELAALYEDEANYDTLFPKVPTMLACYYSKWKQTRELVLIKDSISRDYYGLLKKLGIPTEQNFEQNPAAVMQHEQSTPPVDDDVSVGNPMEMSGTSSI